MEALTVCRFKGGGGAWQERGGVFDRGLIPHVIVSKEERHCFDPMKERLVFVSCFLFFKLITMLISLSAKQLLM